MPKTILLVEDTDDTRQVMRFALERKGYEVLEATDGYQAVDVTLGKKPDLILMDMSLPLMDGLSATRIIRGMEDGSADIPIIVVTAHSHYYAEKALEAGCDAIISKPIDFAILDTFLSEYLN